MRRDIPDGANNIVHRVHRNRNYATIGLRCIEDPDISGLAKAIHTYGITRPDGWQMREADLFKRFARDGRDSKRRAIKELIAGRYLLRERSQQRVQLPSGRWGFGLCIWHWFESSEQGLQWENEHPHVIWLGAEKEPESSVEPATAREFVITESQEAQKPFVFTGFQHTEHQHTEHQHTENGGDLVRNHVVTENPPDSPYQVVGTSERERSHTISWLECAELFRERFADARELEFHPEVTAAAMRRSYERGYTPEQVLDRLQTLGDYPRVKTCKVWNVMRLRVIHRDPVQLPELSDADRQEIDQVRKTIAQELPWNKKGD